MIDDEVLRAGIAARRRARETVRRDAGCGMDDADWDAVGVGQRPLHTPTATDVRHVVDAARTGGLPLATVLAERPVAGRSDAEQLDHVRGWARQVAHAQGMLALEVAGLVARRDDLPEALLGDDPRPLQHFVSCEVAAALGVSQRVAETLVDDAVQLTRRLAETHDALLAGWIDYPTARAIIAETAFVSPEHLAAVEAEALDRARTGTAAQVRATARRAAIRWDATAAREREQSAVAMRCVRRTDLLDGVGELIARLPAADLDAVWAAIEAAGDADRDDGDDRSTDARRADALVALVTGAPRSECRSAAGCDGRPGGGAPGAAPRLADVVVAADTLAGEDDRPGHLVGYGPVTAQTARQLAAGARMRVLPVDADGHALVVAPGTRPPPRGTPVATGDSGPPGDTGPLRTSQAPAAPGSAGETSPPAAGYRPPAAMARLVRAVHRRCRFPGCRRPSRRCDLDHVHAWRPDGRGGETCVDNLVPLCRFHHRCKHSPGWSVRVGPDRAVTWRTPTGHHWTDPPPTVWE